MAKPYRYRGVLIGQGAGVDPKTIEPGTTGQVLTQVVTGSEPAFAAPAAVSLTSGVTGVLPVANGGTGQAVGAIAIMQFRGTVVLANSTVFLGQDDDATEANVQFRYPGTTGTVLSMVSSAPAPAGSDTFTYTLRVGNADTAITHVVTGAAVQGASSGTVAIALLDRISVKLVTSLTAASVNHMVAVAIRVDS